MSEERYMFCKSCGAKIPDDARFCGNCGSAVQRSLPESVWPPQAEQPQPNELPTQGKPKKKRGWIVIAAVAVVIVIAGSLAAFVFRDRLKSIAQNVIFSLSALREESGRQTSSNAQPEGDPAEENSNPVPVETAEPEHRYALVVDGCSWTEAQNKAIEAGGWLACFETQEEYELVLRELNSGGNKDIEYRIGARRELGGTKYYWVDGADRMYGECLNDDGSYAAKLWASGEPSYHWQESSEEYLAIYYDEDLKAWVWSDVADAVYGQDMTKYGYIIEYLDGVELQIPEALFAAEQADRDDSFHDKEPEDDTSASSAGPEETPA